MYILVIKSEFNKKEFLYLFIMWIILTEMNPNPVCSAGRFSSKSSLKVYSQQSSTAYYAIINNTGPIKINNLFPLVTLLDKIFWLSKLNLNLFRLK